jgi:hypothetical protein
MVVPKASVVFARGDGQCSTRFGIRMVADCFQARGMDRERGWRPVPTRGIGGPRALRIHGAPMNTGRDRLRRYALGRRSRPLQLAMILGASAVLSGCFFAERFAEGPMAVHASEGGLQIAICDDFEIVSIDGDVRTVEGGSDWETFMSISGNASLTRGTVIFSTSIPDGLDGRFDGLAVTDVDSLFFSVNGVDDSSDRTFSFSAYFEADGSVPSSGWLHTDGSTTEAPCE